MESKKSKILIVDDEQEVVSALKHFLSLKGYDATGALNGEQALDILEKNTPDLVLLDMVLPGVKGIEIARLIKEKYPAVKLIAVTGHPEEVQKLSQDTALEGFFVKPVGIQELYRKLVDVFEESSTQKIAKAKQGIKARVLFIKAKILLIDPDKDATNFLSSQFKQLHSKGENYDIEMVITEEQIRDKLLSYKPDIVLCSMGYFDNLSAGLKQDMLKDPLKPKETMLYSLSLDEFEQKLMSNVRALCLKHGLLEIKWVEI